jgi:hypothetical protein
MTEDEYKQLYNAITVEGEMTEGHKELIDNWRALVDSGKEAGMTKEFFLKYVGELFQYHLNKLQSGKFKGKQ